MPALWRDDPHNVAEIAGDVARPILDLIYDALIVPQPECRGAAAIEKDRRMHATEELIGLEADVESDPRGVIAPALAGTQPHADVVEHGLFVVDDCGTHLVIAHHVGRTVQEIGVGRGHHDAEIMGQPNPGLSVLNSVKGTRVGAGGGKGANGAVVVAAFDVKLHEPRGRLPGNDAGVSPVALNRHRHAAKRSAIDGISQRHALQAVRISGGDRHGDIFSGSGHDRAVDHALERRADVRL